MSLIRRKTTFQSQCNSITYTNEWGAGIKFVDKTEDDLFIISIGGAEIKSKSILHSNNLSCSEKIFNNVLILEET